VTTPRELVVHAVRAMARDVLAVELRARDGAPLPGAAPGAHVDLHLPNGLVRSYSLVDALGAPAQAAYTVGIARDAASRGGSAWVHEQLRVGQALRVAGPRNAFALDPAHRKVLLVAGGIGITPLVAMARHCHTAGIDWQLLACARSASRLAFVDELRALDPARVRLHVDDEAGGPPELAGLLGARDWQGVYACGPAPMLDALTRAAQAAGWPEGRLRMERFRAAEAEGAPATGFELVLQRCGKTTRVEPQESVLAALERLGVDHPWSCREGLCGSCEAPVLEGTVDHRDSVLGPAERATHDRMLVCVSRCGGTRLVLDL
jgi:ferredoxin-NADP reductase